MAASLRAAWLAGGHTAAADGTAEGLCCRQTCNLLLSKCSSSSMGDDTGMHWAALREKGERCTYT